MVVLDKWLLVDYYFCRQARVGIEDCHLDERQMLRRQWGLSALSGNQCKYEWFLFSRAKNEVKLHVCAGCRLHCDKHRVTQYGRVHPLARFAMSEKASTLVRMEAADVAQYGNMSDGSKISKLRLAK